MCKMEAVKFINGAGCHQRGNVRNKILLFLAPLSDLALQVRLCTQHKLDFVHFGSSAPDLFMQVDGK